MDHAYILNAYVSRLTLGDLENLLTHARKCTHAAMNLNNSASNDASAALFGVVAQAVENLIEHDRVWINGIIESEVLK